MRPVREIRKTNLIALMERRGENQASFARALGKDRNQVYQWLKSEGESSARGISDTTAREIERTLGLPVNWMDQDHDGRVVTVPAFTIRAVDGRDGVNFETDVMIPVMDIEVSAGNGTPVPEFLPTRYELPYQIAWLHSVGARPTDILIMPVRGRSMEPVLWHGDKVVLHRGRTDVRDGCVYALLHNGEARVKRLFRKGAGLRVTSDNPDKQRYPDELVEPEDMHRVLILGQAIDRMGAGGLGL
jgi:phage repressor protein C with HTH and peptisase S24 domain